MENQQVAELPQAELDEKMIAAMQQKVGTRLRIEHSVNNDYASRIAVAKFAGALIETVQATLYRSSAQVLYAGPAPGLLAGFFQVNIRVPAMGLEDWVPLGISVADQMGQSQSGNAEVGIYVSCPPGSTCARFP